MHFELLLQPPLDPRNWPLADLAVSHNGMQFVYRGISQSGSQLYIRAVNRMESTPIPGTGGAYDPFFSPDGHWLGFFTERTIKKISLESGASPVSLCNVVMGSGASWEPQDNIIFTAGVPGSLMQVPATGGIPRTLMTADFKKGEQAFRLPQVLPDGKSVVVTLVNADMDPAHDAMVLYRLDTGERRPLVQGNVARYAATGDLVYARGQNLYAAPFDLNQSRVKQQSVPVVDNLMTTSGRATFFALNERGSLAYAAGGPSIDRRELVWVDRQGKTEPVPIPVLPYERPRLSPKGDRVAVTVHDPKPEMRIYGLPKGAQAKLLLDAAQDESPTWRPDGKQVTFASSRSGHRIICSKPVIGNGAEEVLFAGTQYWQANSWSPDGKQLALESSDPKTNGDIWILPADGQRTPKPLVRTPYHERGARLSPDGLWLAYASDESGRDEIYVQSVPAPSAKFQVSMEGGVEPVWGQDGRELFFRNHAKMMASPVTIGDAFTAGTPHVLFEGQFATDPWGEANYDIAPGSGRFLMVRNLVQTVPTQVHVVTDWFEELKSLVPHEGH
jgi:Tol biopolymer transport system component